MWNLNESEGCSSHKTDMAGLFDDEKGKRIGSNSSGLDEEAGEQASRTNKHHSITSSKSNKLFGFSLNHHNTEQDTSTTDHAYYRDHHENNMPVTRQFFPDMGKAPATIGGGSAAMLPQAHWAGFKFRPTGNKSTEVSSSLPPSKRSRRGPRSRSSQYRGVTFYRRTGRWESHIWDCGKQVYLGGFDTAHAAARAYDRAAMKFRGVEADINFSPEDYEQDFKQVMFGCCVDSSAESIF